MCCFSSLFRRERLIKFFDELFDGPPRTPETTLTQREMDLARSIQERLLPPTELSGEGYRIAARHLPARYVAGDFFDVFSLPDGALGLVVADVAGKGDVARVTDLG